MLSNISRTLVARERRLTIDGAGVDEEALRRDEGRHHQQKLEVREDQEVGFQLLPRTSCLVNSDNAAVVAAQLVRW